MVKKNLGGAIYLTVLGLMLVLSGSLFTWLMWRSYDRASEMRGWNAHEAIVLRCEIDERKIGPDVPTEYRVGLLYGYDIDGQAYTGDRITLRANPWTKTEEKARKAIAKLEEGESVTCYTKPGQPELAVLKADTKAPGYSIWFPIVFVIGGLGIIAGAIRSLFSPPRARSSDPVPPA